MNGEIKLQNQQYLSSAIGHLCLGNPYLGYTLINKANKLEAQSVLEAIVQSQVPPEYIPSEKIPSKTHFRWTANSLLYRLGKYIEIPVGKLYDYELYKMKINQAVEYRQAIMNTQNNDKKSILKLMKAYFDFSGVKPSFARVYLPYMKEMAEIIGYDIIFQHFGLQGLCFVDKTTLTELALQLNDISDYKEFYQYPKLPIEIFSFYQNCFASDFPFPSKSFLSNNPNLSAINTAIATHTDILTVVHDVALSQCKTGLTLESYRTIQCSCLQMDDYIFLSILTEDPPKDLLKIKFNSNSIAADVLVRMQNDHKLLDHLRDITGCNIFRNAFIHNSLPFFMQPILQCNESSFNFDLIFKNNFFIISDFDLTIDADFICYYFALATSLNIIMGNAPIEESARIEGFLEMIIDDYKISSCLVDIFSSIFICPTTLEAAEAICTVILNFANDPILLKAVQTAHARIQTEKFMESGGSLKNCFSSRRSQVDSALMGGDKQIALHAAGNDLKLREFVEKYTEILEFRNSGQRGFVGSDSASIEVGFSYEDELPSLLKSENMDIVVKKCRDDRIKKRGMNLLNAIKNIDQALIHKLTRKLGRMGSDEWEQTELGSEDFGIFASFFHYLDAIIPPLLAQHPTVYDCLLVDRVQIIRDLILSKHIEEAKNASATLKVDFEMEFFSMKLTKDVAECLTKDKATLDALSLSNDWGTSNNVLKRLQKPQKRTQTLIEKLEECTSETELIDFVDQVFDQEDENCFIELSERLSNFSHFLLKKLDNKYFAKISLFLDKLLLDDVTFDKVYCLSGIDRPFPINQTIKNLIKDNIEKAKLIVNSYPEYSSMLNFLNESKLQEKQYEKHLQYNMTPIQQRSIKTLETLAKDIYRSRSLSSFPELIKKIGEIIYIDDSIIISLGRVSELIKSQHIETKEASMIVLLSNLLRERLGSRFGISMTPINLFDQKYGLRIAEGLFNYDLPYLEEVVKAYDLKDFQNEIELKRFKQLIKMSLFNDAAEMIPFKSNIYKILYDEIVSIHPINANNNSFNGIFKCVCSPERSLSSEQLNLIQKFIKFSPLEVKARALYFNFNTFADLSSSISKDEFINLILPIAIELGKVHEICKLPQQLMKATLNLANLFKILNLKLELERALDLKSEAARTAISLFCSNGFGQNNFSYLDFAEAVLSAENPLNDETNYLLNSIRFQRLFCVFCTERKLFGFSELALFGSDSARIAIVVLLLKGMSIDLAIAIIKYYNLDVKAVSIGLTDALINDGTLANCIRRITDVNFQKAFAFHISERLLEIASVDEAVDFINALQDNELRALLLAQYGYINESANIIIKFRLSNIAPLVGQLAHRAGNSDVIQKVQRVLQ